MFGFEKFSMNSKKSWLAFSVLLVSSTFLMGCNGSVADYQKTCIAAKRLIPEANELERAFKNTEYLSHQIPGFGRQNCNKWITEVYFGGRYHLIMTVPIKVNYSNNCFETLGDPSFTLLEYSSAKKIGGNRIQTTVGRNWDFPKASWQKIFSNGEVDFSKIGIQLNEEALGNFDEHAENMISTRIPIHLSR